MTIEAPPLKTETSAVPCEETSQQEGIATGVNIRPGDDDDGWTVPPPVQLSDGSTVQLYKDGESLHAAAEAIRSAKSRICLEVYIFASDDTGRSIAELLAKRAREGVKVYVIYDSFGSMRSDRKMFDMMRRAGVRMLKFHPIAPWECRFSWRPFNRDHRKLLIIDSDIASLGGINVGAEYAGSWIVKSSRPECDFWRDNAIGIRGPAVRAFLKSFARTWRYINQGGRIVKAEFWQPLGEGDVGVLASVPTAHSPLQPKLQEIFRQARHSIMMTMAYFAPDDALIDELARAARRGVRVRLMLPAICDVHLLVIAARSFYEKLMGAGVEVYERQHVVLHAKTICIDERISIVGSTNLDYRSIEYNLELSAIIRSNEFGKQMRALFENDVKFAQRIDPKVWRRRPWIDRFGQWAVSRARYLL